MKAISRRETSWKGTETSWETVRFNKSDISKCYIWQYFKKTCQYLVTVRIASGKKMSQGQLHFDFTFFKSWISFSTVRTPLVFKYRPNWQKLIWDFIFLSLALTYRQLRGGEMSLAKSPGSAVVTKHITSRRKKTKHISWPAKLKIAWFKTSQGT